MPETWVITAVYEHEGPRGIRYEVSVRRPDGVLIFRCFDMDVLEFRAAEYGVDPDTEFDLLLDMVLYELHIPDPTEPKNFEEDVAWKAGMKSCSTRAWGRRVAVGDEVPTWLGNAETVQAAREAHLLRIEEVKKRMVVVPGLFSMVRGASKPQEQLDIIRNNGVDPDRVAEKSRWVHSFREAELQRVHQSTPQVSLGRPAPGASRQDMPMDPTAEARLARSRMALPETPRGNDIITVDPSTWR